ncbi:MAG: hypothetical protein ACRYFX_05675 [Janthinobacterium lividum]
MTQKEAVAIYESGIWKDWTAREKVLCQLYEERLIMPFDEFTAAMSEVLGRPVFTHEFANPKKLEAEFEGEIGSVSLQESIADLRRMLLQAQANKNSS